MNLSHTGCRYDVGGFNNLQGCDFEVDLSSAGLVNTALIAVFSKLGRALMLIQAAMHELLKCKLRVHTDCGCCCRGSDQDSCGTSSAGECLRGQSAGITLAFWHAMQWLGA